MAALRPLQQLPGFDKTVAVSVIRLLFKQHLQGGGCVIRIGVEVIGNLSREFRLPFFESVPLQEGLQHPLRLGGLKPFEHIDESFQE